MPDLGLRRMQGRDPDEDHRGATPLEAFFDLCFVVAVSFASFQLHHGFLDGHGWQALGGYILVFFAIWWAWVNFTWFASAYDTDDWFYRLTAFVQIAGVLVLAAGVPRASNGDFFVVSMGYLVLRIGLIVQCVRAAIEDPEHRRVVLTYAVGFGVVQVGWMLRLALPPGWYLAASAVLIPLEFLVPMIAERSGHMPWNPSHLEERYGLFTLIVLGESVLASTNSVVEGVSAAEHPAPIVILGVVGLVITFGMWWVYFFKPSSADLTDLRSAIIWGYGHYLVFASAAAFSAGLELAIDYQLQHSGDQVGQAGEHTVMLDGTTTAMLSTVPVAVFLFSTWLLMVRPRHARELDVVMLAAAVGVLATSFTPAPVPLTAAVVTAEVITLVLLGVRHDHAEQEQQPTPDRAVPLQ